MTTTTTRKTVLLVGATGIFGGRLAQHLCQDFTGIDLVVTSRNGARAQHLADALAATAAIPVKGVAFDTGGDLATQLAALKPWAVIDCTGPFQTADYRLAEAAIASGAHIIDLADAEAYLTGYREHLHGLAKAAGVLAIAGASSTPGLSGAVIAAICDDWQGIDDIDMAIVPGGRSAVGQSVIEAVLSYAGQPVTVYRNGTLDVETGWRQGHEIDLPGLGRRRVALVETADAALLNRRYSITGSIRFHAGLEATVEQRGMEALAWLRHRHLLGDVARLVPWLQKARGLTRLVTGDRGGMMVDVHGRDAAGIARHARWTLVAVDDDGPYVPVMATATALALLLDAPPAAGAWLAGDLLLLDAIEAQMTGYAITTALEIWAGDTAEGRELERAAGGRLRRFGKAKLKPFLFGQPGGDQPVTHPDIVP